MGVIPLLASSSKTFQVRIAGSASDIKFSGHCNLHLVNGDIEIIDFYDEGNFERRLAGTKLTCRITQLGGDGFLDVEIESSHGNRSRSRTSGAGSSITLSQS